MGMIDTHINSSEERFSFPISFERVYRDYWYKFAEEKELYWLKFFLYGIELEISDFDEVRLELKLFKNFLLKEDDIYYLPERSYIVSIRPSPIAMASRDEVTTHLDHLE